MLLHRSHEPDVQPDVRLRAEDGTLTLSLPQRWLDARPLLASDLATETRELSPLGIRLAIDTGIPALA